MRINNIENEKENLKFSYIRSLYAKEDDILLKIKKDLISANRPININPEEGKLLQLLIKLNNSKKILEIGTLYGYSTIWLARGLLNLNNDNIKIITIEKDEESCKIARKNFEEANLEKYIELINDNAVDALNNIDDKFDLIFIDANKGDYKVYFDWADKHLNQNGIIVLDNTFLSGAVYEKELPERITNNCKNKMVELNKFIADNRNYISLLLPTYEGLTIAVKN